jgi:YXWGXW repeat-containing protein
MRSKVIRSLVFALALLSVSAASSAQVFLSVSIGPPPLPFYEQPLCPGEDYIFVPGYWAWSPVGYYWVPGTWVLAPEPGLLWTPGYWAFESAAYYWHPGYWGPVVGYYGGISYGFGYPGTGYYGGYWRDRHFFYNQTVNNVNVTQIHYVYRAPVVSSTVVTRVSFNGGPGGTTARPTAAQLAVARERHVAPTSAQVQHEHAASADRNLLAARNHGRPPIAATTKPGDISGRGAVAAGNAGTPNRAVENREARPSTPARNPESRPEPKASRPQPEERRTPPPESRPEPKASRPQPEERRTPPPESRPEPRASRPQPEERRTPAPHVETPRQPNASGRENPPHPENAPHSERQPRPENAHPKDAPPGKGEAHSDKKAPPHSGGEEPRR